MDILLVDDDEKVLKSMARFLSAVGHHLSVASNGVEALEQMEQNDPELVISDIRMPGMDGVALLETIADRSPNVPVILMTGFRSVETAVAALRRKAFDYLQKPVQPEELLDCIERLQRDREERC